jgi:hypothetical protein
MADRLVALYKTWDGGEFIDASLASIYDSVDAIVMVHSHVSWLGEPGNTVRPAAMAWCAEHDRDGKVLHISVSSTSQEEQYAIGVAEIRRLDLGDVVMVVDADEVWEPQYVENARRWMAQEHCPVYRCRMHTYLKSPFFRVWPPTGWPVAFARDMEQLSKSPRACRAKGPRMTDVWMHHFTYVRETRAAVKRKLQQSARADGGEQVVDGWMESVYDRLPEGADLHAFVRWREMWKQIEKIWWPDLPAAMRTCRLLPLWLPPGEMLDGEMNALHRLARGRGQAVDLGTHHGRSAAVLSLACRRVYTVDCYDALPEGTFADTLEPGRYETWEGGNLRATQALAKRLGNLTCEQSLTHKAGHEWTSGPVDLLFVDADHSERAVLRDVRAWMPSMREGSRIVFHDNNDIHPGVQRAIQILLDSGEFESVDPGAYSGSIAAMDVK